MREAVSCSTSSFHQIDMQHGAGCDFRRKWAASEVGADTVFRLPLVAVIVISRQQYLRQHPGLMKQMVGSGRVDKSFALKKAKIKDGAFSFPLQGTCHEWLGACINSTVGSSESTLRGSACTSAGTEIAKASHPCCLFNLQTMGE